MDINYNCTNLLKLSTLVPLFETVKATRDSLLSNIESCLEKMERSELLINLFPYLSHYVVNGSFVSGSIGS